MWAARWRAGRGHSPGGRCNATEVARHQPLAFPAPRFGLSLFTPGKEVREQSESAAHSIPHWLLHWSLLHSAECWWTKLSDYWCDCTSLLGAGLTGAAEGANWIPHMHTQDSPRQTACGHLLALQPGKACSLRDEMIWSLILLRFVPKSTSQGWPGGPHSVLWWPPWAHRGCWVGSRETLTSCNLWENQFRKKEQGKQERRLLRKRQAVWNE
jgi:hypothetical protein